MRLRDFTRSGHPPTLFSAFLYFDVSFMIWVLIGVLGVYIAKDFGLSATQKGFMAAIPLLGGSIVRIPLGLLVDHMGPKKTGMVAQLAVILPLLGIWLFSPALKEVLAFGLLLGIAGGSFAVALPLASRWYPPEYQGLAMGIAGAGNSGTALATFFAPRLAEHWGWHAVFGFALLPILFTLLAFVLLARDSPSHVNSTAARGPCSRSIRFRICRDSRETLQHSPTVPGITAPFPGTGPSETPTRGGAGSPSPQGCDGGATDSWAAAARGPQPGSP